MQQLTKDFQTILKSLKALTQKFEKMKKQLDVLGKKQAAAKTKPKVSKAKATVSKAKAKVTKKTITAKSPQKKATAPTAYDTFLGIINRGKKGVSVEQLKAKTGYNDKKIANLVFKAKKQQKIKSGKRGVYVKA